MASLNNVTVVKLHRTEPLRFILISLGTTVADNIDEAYGLIKDLEPSSPQEYILKAVANTVIGQEHGAVSDKQN